MSTKIRGIKFKTVGVKFKNENGTSRQEIISNMSVDSPVSIKREPTNRFDTNAVMVMYVDQQIGYVSKEFAKILAPLMDSGRRFVARVDEVDCYENTWYCHIIVDEV